MRRDKRKGVAAVEMALVAPIFIIIAMGVIEYGRAIQLKSMATTASALGARIYTETGDLTQVQTEIENYLNGTFTTLDGREVSNRIAAYTIPTPVETADNVAVTVQIDYDAEALLPRLTYVGSNTISGTTVHRKTKL